MQVEQSNYRKRKTYYINKEFQGKFIIKFCCLIILACMLFGVMIYALSLKTTTTAFENSRLVLKTTADYLLPFLALTSLITVVVVGLATIIVTLFISHKIAGPAYRFGKVAEAIAKGNLNLDVKLRSEDQLQPIAEGLDAMAKKLRQEILNTKEKVADLSAFIDKLRSNQDDKVKIHFNTLQKIVDELNQEISYFKL